MEDSVKFLFGLGGDVIVEVFIPVGDVLPEIDLSGVNLAVEHLFPVIGQHTALVVCLQNGKEEHVLNVGGGHDSPTLTHWSSGLYPDLLLNFSTDDGLCLMGIGGVAGVRHVGMQPVSKEFLDNRDRAIVGLSDVPKVSEPFGVAVSRVPRPREGPLMVFVDNLVAFNNQGDSPEVQLIVEGYDVVVRLTGLVLIPLTLACDVGNLVCRKSRGLRERSPVHQVGDVIRLIQVDGSGEFLPMHHGGVVFRSVRLNAKPRQALFDRHALQDQERPVHGVQFRVSVNSAIATDVRPGKEAHVCGDVPFLLLLEELKPCRSIFSDGCSSGAAVTGRDTAVSLHLGGIGAVIGREVVSSFHRAIPIPKGEAVGGCDGKKSCDGS